MSTCKTCCYFGHYLMKVPSGSVSTCTRLMPYPFGEIAYGNDTCDHYEEANDKPKSEETT